MVLLEKSLEMLESHPLCDHCLGRQFAFLGSAMENEERGNLLKTVLLMKAQALALAKDENGVRILKILATNGFYKAAEEILHVLKRRIPKKNKSACFLCMDSFNSLDQLAEKASEVLKEWECRSFHVGIELPVEIEEREDEFKAKFRVLHGESMRSEFGRLLGKKISLRSGKTVDYSKPDVVLIVNPITYGLRIQVNPLYIAGRYRKLVRGIPQSKWFCSSCGGRGCERCNFTGKMYSESVEEIITEPALKMTEGSKAYFHASGREDVDARMLGRGRPFVIEISQPKKRFLDLKDLEKAINVHADGKVEVLNLHFVDKAFVRRLKKAESAQKYYRVVVEFEKEVSDEELKMLEKKLTNTMIKQRTPLRVLHRRADVTREKYIYKVKIKRLSPKNIELKVCSQGGLYVKELVTGDDGRTNPSVSSILGIKAKPLSLDVLDVYMKDIGEGAS